MTGPFQTRIVANQWRGLPVEQCDSVCRSINVHHWVDVHRLQVWKLFPDITADSDTVGLFNYTIN